MKFPTISVKGLIYLFAISSVLVSASLHGETKLLNVNIAPLSSILIATKNSAPANVISLNDATISAEITGRAITIHSEVGSFVRQGEMLASIDCRSYKLAKKQADAALKVANAQLNLTKKQLKRNQRLIQQGTIPREIFEKTEAAQQTSLADIELKKASIENAKLTIQRCSIKAPFSGQITQRMVQQGQLVLPGTPLFQLMQDQALEIKANLPAASIDTVKGINSIVFVSDDKKIKTTIRSIILNIDETTRTQEVRFSIPDSAQLVAGLSGRIEWSDGSLQVPTEYIQRKGQNLGIMIADEIMDGTAKAKFIILKDAIEGQPASIDLPRETAIINKNQFRVTDGQLISIQ